MFHLAIPVAIIVAIKAYFAFHGVQIGIAAFEAGYKAYRRGGDEEDVIEAAVRAGATRAAALILFDALKKYISR
jgi:hypothetical protein